MMKNRFLFVAMLFAALSLGFVSCDNKGNEPEDPVTEQGSLTEEEILNLPIHMNKELYFTEKKSESKQIEVDTVKKYLAILNEDGSFVFDTVFLVPVGTFFAPDYYDHPGYFKMARDALLQELIDLSPRVRGKGDFITNLGYPSQYGEDSLWMVENGWTVNKYWIDQLNQNTK